MENTLSNLSIADLKAALEFVQEQKKDRITDLKEQQLDTKNDVGLNRLDKLEFEIHQVLFGRIVQLSKQD